MNNLNQLKQNVANAVHELNETSRKINEKPVLIFTTADQNNFPYAVSMLNSLSKFHPDVDTIIFTNEKDATKLQQLPKHVVVEDLTPYLEQDPHFFYRQKPVIGEKYIKEYELVIGLDADQIILGDISYLWETKDYDVACVLNYNELDAKQFGLIGGWGILPIEYVNCGLVAMRNEKFVHEWYVACFSEQFNRLQYREQDLLNAKIYFGNWNVRILEHMDGKANMQALWGVFGKTFWNRCVLQDDKVILPKSDEEKKFPDKDTEIKVIHMGGGSGASKDNWGIYFNDEIMKRIEYLVSEVKL